MLKKLLIAFLATCALGAVAAEKKVPPVEVFIPHMCLACLDWAEHLRQNGFPKVTVKEVDDMAALADKAGRVLFTSWHSRGAPRYSCPCRTCPQAPYSSRSTAGPL